MIDSQRLKILASDHHKENKIFLEKLRKKKPGNLDKIFHDLHNDVFLEINCLECANCCKSISPIIIDKDIQRIASRLKLKPSEFTEEYLLLDKDNDYVFKQSPCPFLMPDNYCVIYEDRPRACREYPHTNRRRMYQLLKLALKNAEYCPAVYEIIHKLKEEFKSI